MKLKSSITGIILAGGKSARMKSDKSQVVFNNRKLIEYPLNLLQSFCDELIISGNSNELSDFGFKLVSDEKLEIGPIGGIYSGLKASKNELNFIISCDMPLVTIELIEYLYSQLSDEFDAVVSFSENDKIEPLCAFYRRSILPKVKYNIDNQHLKLIKLLHSINTRFVKITNDLPFYNANIFYNVNSVSDLQKLNVITGNE